MIGSVVLATEQGLGFLARDFYDHGVIDKVFIHPHTTRTNHPEWYRKEDIVRDADDLLQCDALLFFETPFNWDLIVKARNKGIKTVLIPMYECTAFPFPYEPDEIWSPSALDHKFYGEKSTKQIQIPVEMKWKLHKKAHTFVHNAGNGGLGGRNGTRELIEAFNHTKSDAKLILRSQIPVKCSNPKIDLRIGTFEDIWNDGDVFIFPEKFNGLCLPLQEAFAAGMLVMAGDRFPMNTWLPTEPLIPVKGYHTEKIAVDFDYAEYDPVEIAKCIDFWYDKPISKFSLQGKVFNENNSWTKLKEIYIKSLSA